MAELMPLAGFCIGAFISNGSMCGCGTVMDSGRYTVYMNMGGEKSPITETQESADRGAHTASGFISRCRVGAVHDGVGSETGTATASNPC